MPASPPRQRWLLVGDLPPPEHGSALAFAMLCRELKRCGFPCRVLDIARHDPQSPSLARSVEVLATFGRFAAGLARRHRRAYIVISQSLPGFLRDMLLIWSACAVGCSVVVHLHGGNYDGFYRRQSAVWRFLIRATLRRARRIVALSERLRGMYAFDRALADKVVVVPNGSPEALPGRARVWAPAEVRTVRLLYLSNLIQSKGYADVLAAAAILRREAGLRFELVFAGRFLPSVDDRHACSPAQSEQAFRARIEAEDLSDTVRYVGPVTGRAKWRLFESADIFLLPTNYRHEGQPVSVIEAMAHGCVVVATAFRAIPDMLVDGETGVVVDYEQPRQIAGAVRRIAADAGRYTAMSKAAVQRYQEHFTQTRHVRTMVGLLDSV